MVRLERDRLEDELGRIGESLAELKEVFVAGGSSLVFYGLKRSTKDIDLVTKSDAELSRLVGALKELGYVELSRGNVSRYGFPNPSKPKDYLGYVDLSVGGLGRVTLTKSMRERCRRAEFGKTVYNFLHPTDVLLTKIDVIARDWASDDIGDFKRIVESRLFNRDTLSSEFERQPRGKVMRKKFRKVWKTIFGSPVEKLNP